MIASWEFQLPSGGDLPAFEAGAHIDVHLRNGMTRSYSLLNSQADRQRYVIASQKECSGRGGSVYLHESVHAQDRIFISPPRNNFPLDEGARHSVFIAGGIGITPILSMVRRLNTLDASWELYYCARTQNDAAFLNELAALQSSKGKVRLTFDREPDGKMLDIVAVVAQAPRHSHFYCCGPLPMLESFRMALADWPPGQVHLEYFSATGEASTNGGFTVMLAQSGKEVFVPEGKSILNALLDAGVEAPHSCCEGVCGSCEVRVLEGIPDHRDLVLTPAEREANQKMMICYSGSASPRLVLDL